MRLNNNPHTARFQLSLFLQSEESQQLPLDGKDVAILMTIFDFMDSGEKEECFADQLRISKVSRVPRSTLIERIKKYQQLNLIIKKRIGYKNYYYIGDSIKKYVQQWDIVSPVTGHSMSSSRTLYKNNYKNKYNKQTPVDNFEKKKEPKSLVQFWEPGNPDYDRVNKK